jgi:hypothetical protein
MPLDGLFQLVVLLPLLMMLLLSTMMLRGPVVTLLLSPMVLLWLMMATMSTALWRLVLRLTALEIDEDTALILLVSLIPQTQLATKFLDFGLQLLAAAR